ncbi:MAG: pirin family protein [Candidatus Aminicenantales bacterium]
MEQYRRVKKTFAGRPTLEGAGVKLRRVFGFREVPLFDPFLMFDDFGSEIPEDYIAGFPWHPHRGIETVTYMLAGTVTHGDSLGNEGTIGPGRIQWMTAGRGIIHQEMPQRQPDRLRGIQIWINLPRSYKMMPPRYRDIAAEDIPEISLPSGGRIKVIAGRYGEVKGPVAEIIGNPSYLDVELPPAAEWARETPSRQTAFVYVLSGDGVFDAEGTAVAAGRAALFSHGPAIRAVAGKNGARFILLSAAPIGEPVAWRGPIVMNTTEELDQAFREYEAGTFIQGTDV